MCDVSVPEVCVAPQCQNLVLEHCHVEDIRFFSEKKKKKKIALCVTKVTGRNQKKNDSFKKSRVSEQDCGF
jgi:hypothetical protein